MAEPKWSTRNNSLNNELKPIISECQRMVVLIKILEIFLCFTNETFMAP